MKYRFILFLAIVLSVPSPLWAQEKASLAASRSDFSVPMEGLAPGEQMPPLPKGPLMLTGITPDQLSADYWIRRLPNPDLMLKTPEQLKLFNQEIDMMIHERVDIFAPNPFPTGREIQRQIEREYQAVSSRKLFDHKGKPIEKTLFERDIKPLVQWETVPARLEPKWGAAIRATSVRALPTRMKMLEAPDDIEFDQLQFTLIKLWTPVAILHVSKDWAWYYVQAPYVRGWVRAKEIAVFPSKRMLEERVKWKQFLVVTGESVPVCADPACTTIYQRPTMGTVIPLFERREDVFAVALPFLQSNGNVILKEAYIPADADVHAGFPAFTQRNIITQAFKLLSARYGWGGMYNGRDCSGFTHDVFLSMGVDLPRDSDQQALTGTQLGHFQLTEDANQKVAALRTATPGITLLKMPLHMMLYLGEIDGRFYIIHSTWAERISMTSDEKNRINQVIVSDMSLNGHSYLGSLFDRTVSINELD